MKKYASLITVIILTVTLVKTSSIIQKKIPYVYAGVIGGDEPIGGGEPGGGEPGPTQPGLGEPGQQQPTTAPTEAPTPTIAPTEAPTPTIAPTEAPTPTSLPGAPDGPGKPGGGEPGGGPVPTCPSQLPCKLPTPTPTGTSLSCGGTCNPNESNNSCGVDRVCVRNCRPNSPGCSNGTCQNANPVCQEGKESAAGNCQCKSRECKPEEGPNCCSCKSLSCPDSDPNKGRAKIKPIIDAPACFICQSFTIGGEAVPCGDLGNAERSFDKADGKKCRFINASVEGADGKSCSCSAKVCCPDCEPPKEEPADPVGDPAACKICSYQTTIGDKGATCPCVGKNITFQSDNPGCIDFGDGQAQCGGAGNPPEHEYGDAGFYKIRQTCKDATGKEHTCIRETTLGCSCTDTEPKPTPFGGLDAITATPAWYKLRDDQFHKLDVINDPIPPTVHPYDGDDTPRPTPACVQIDGDDIRCFDLNQAGVVASASTIELNGAPVSFRGWQTLNYPKNPNPRFTPELFIQYARSRKAVVDITDVSQIQKNKINILKSDLTINDFDRIGGQKVIDILEDSSRIPYVLILDGGTLTFDTDFNTSQALSAPKSITMIATKAINISYAVREIGGIFIGDTLDFSYDEKPSPWSLKIKGNMISSNAADPADRKRDDDPLKPSIFMIFEPQLYRDQLPFFSDTYSQWEELAP